MMRTTLLFGILFCATSLGAAADPTPMQIPHGQKDVTLAVAGTYTLDPNHVAGRSACVASGILDERVPLRQGQGDARMGPEGDREIETHRNR